MTETRRYALIRRLNRLIAEMSRPLPVLERIRGTLGRRDAWTEGSRREWRTLLLELRERVASGESGFETEAQHLGCWLDHDGISSGRWADEIGAVQDDLRALARDGSS